MKIDNSDSQPVLSFSLFFQNNNNFDQSDLFLSKKHNIDWEALFSVSSEVSNDWLPFSFGVYNLQHVQADNSFFSHVLLNSCRERNNRWRDCFGSDVSLFNCTLWNHNKLYISEPIIESVPQVHILLCLWALNPKLITGQKYFYFDFDSFFIATFATSIISASKGIASFLMDGPCKLVPKNGLFGGLGTLGFIFLCLSNISTSIGKGSMLAFSYTESRFVTKVSTSLFWIPLGARI